MAQLLQWLVLFLLMFGTYLFQVGLLGVLAKEFRAVTYAMPIYFVVWLLHTGHKMVSEGCGCRAWHRHARGPCVLALR